jgi:hypothetical protein
LISYRPLHPGDVPAFVVLHVQCWHNAYTGLTPQEMIESMTVAKRIEGWRKTLAGSGVFALGAFDSNAPIGFLLSGPAREDAKELTNGQILAI